MSTSLSQTVQLTCPQCSTPFDAELWLVVDVRQRPDLLARAQETDLHRIPCPHCGFVGGVDAPLLFFRPGEDPVLLFSPAQGTTQEQDQEQAGGLVGSLRQALGDAWQDAWLEQTTVVPRPFLATFLKDGPQAAAAQAQAQTTAEKERLQREDPQAYQSLLLQHTMQEFLSADTWTKSQEVLTQHPELLTDAADALLAHWLDTAAQQKDEQAQRIFTEHRQLLMRCREVGVERAFAEKVQSQGQTGVHIPAGFEEDVRRMLEIRERLQREPHLRLNYIEIIQGVLKRLSQGQHPAFYAALHNDLGTAYKNLPTGDRAENLRRAIQCYSEALTYLTVASDPVKCRSTAYRKGVCLSHLNKWQAARDAFSMAMHADRQVLAEQLSRQSKEASLGETAGLHAAAAYAFARLGDLPRAVQTLEHGRARLLAEALSLTGAEVHALESAQPALAKRFRAAAQALSDLRSRELNVETPYEELYAELRTAQADMDAVLNDIHQHEDFEDFLEPPSFAKICPAAASAPLLYCAVTEVGGLALRLDAGGQVTPVWLAGLTQKTLREIVQGPDEETTLGGYLGAYTRWRSAPYDETARRAWFTALDETARWLGEVWLQPLLDEGVLPAPPVVLVPQGWLSLLPLHAAWLPDSSRPTARCYALDLANLTYTPNAQALLAARARLADMPSAETILAVDDPSQTLPFSAYEVQAVLGHFPAGKSQCYRGQQAALELILEEIPRFSLLHFSTHGAANFRQPLESSLLMAHGERLTLRRLLDLHLSGLRLAVLSACETGVPGTRTLDESISLPAGWLQAGAAGVVASLWSVADASTMMLMARFYDLWREDGLPPAEALRQAQIWLRDTTNKQKSDYFAGSLPEFQLLVQRMAEDAARQAHRESVLAGAENDLSFAPPFHWAAFGYTGV